MDLLNDLSSYEAQAAHAEPTSDLSTGAPPVSLRGNQLSETLHLNENEIIYREGDAPKGLYYVKSGAVKIVTNRRWMRGRVSSPEFVTKLVGPGEFFGYEAIINKKNHTTLAKTVRETEIQIYPKETVKEGTRESGALLTQIMKELQAHEVINQLHYLASVQERIAYQLLLLADKFGTPGVSGTLIDLKLTRNELAQLAGTINESLSRHLTELKNENIIELFGKQIIVKDRARLMAKSGNFHE